MEGFKVGDRVRFKKGRAPIYHIDLPKGTPFNIIIANSDYCGVIEIPHWCYERFGYGWKDRSTGEAWCGGVDFQHMELASAIYVGGE